MIVGDIQNFFSEGTHQELGASQPFLHLVLHRAKSSSHGQN